MRNACPYACHLLDPINDLPIKSLPESFARGRELFIAVKETSDRKCATVKVKKKKKKHGFQFAHFRSLVMGNVRGVPPLAFASRSY